MVGEVANKTKLTKQPLMLTHRKRVQPGGMRLLTALFLRLTQLGSVVT